MKKIILLLLVVIALTSCYDNTYKNEGFLHPSNPKLHNIEVVDKEVYTNQKVDVYYYSFTDSLYHRCRVNRIYNLNFIIGQRIK